ncbi:MAG: hypothetical protein M3Y13_15130 [Armatimonadota bacterium]|nr:hypothetical protein [Armatimonadota bacterium]
MTVTLNIPSDMEPLLQQKAAQRGQTVPDYLLALTEAALYEDWQSAEDREEEIAIIEQGLAELHAGDRGMLLEDYRAEVMAKRAERKQRQNIQAAAWVVGGHY